MERFAAVCEAIAGTSRKNEKVRLVALDAVRELFGRQRRPQSA